MIQLRITLVSYVLGLSRLKLSRALFKRGLILIVIFPMVGSGPFLEVLQDQANPWWSRSKLLHLHPVAKISLISMAPSGGRIRY